MQIILQEDVEKLGNRGELVDVAAGYARNFLLPRKLGIEATPGNMKRLERMRVSFAKKEATEKGAAQTLADSLQGVSLGVYAQSGRERTALRLGNFGRHRRSSGGAGLSHRQAQDHAGRSHQGRRRLRDPREAAPRDHFEREGHGKKRRVANLRFRNFCFPRGAACCAPFNFLPLRKISRRSSIASFPLFRKRPQPSSH